MAQPTFLQAIGVEHPIIQTPMAGGATTVDLAVGVCEAGALGVLGCAYSSPHDIDAAAAAVRARTTKPFGINLFAPLPPPEPPTDASVALAALAEAHAELGLAADYLSLWAGQGIRLARELPAGELVRQIAAETARALDRAGSRTDG